MCYTSTNSYTKLSNQPRTTNWQTKFNRLANSYFTLNHLKLFNPLPHTHSQCRHKRRRKHQCVHALCSYISIGIMICIFRNPVDLILKLQSRFYWFVCTFANLNNLHVSRDFTERTASTASNNNNVHEQQVQLGRTTNQERQFKTHWKVEEYKNRALRTCACVSQPT